jgi:hypothetical protein
MITPGGRGVGRYDGGSLKERMFLPLARLADVTQVVRGLRNEQALAPPASRPHQA